MSIIRNQKVQRYALLFCFVCLLFVIPRAIESKVLLPQTEIKNEKAPSAAVTSHEEREKPQTNLPVAVPDIIFGHEDAPITIIEYSSLNCAACGHFHRTVFPHIKSKYIDTGKVRLIFRHFPIDEYAAQLAAILSCAPEINHPTLIQRLYEQQLSWIKAADPILEISKITGIELEKCRQAAQNKEVQDSIFMKRIQAEKEITIDGTPTFIINGRIINHAPTLERLESYIGLEKAKTAMQKTDGH